ncbi:low molecular weight protein-tyrosine-phosphatase [Tropicimonas sp.]|uniref:low molecular weight protein-tyrosine-phosphatase n=1 Tax=Tropicimonas sp. TaxID=2067044 RepID=UPI003A899DD6
MDSDRSSPPRVLFVCLGNICRSPAAEGVTRALARRIGFDVVLDSAGTGGWYVGAPPDPRMREVAAAARYDISDLRARQFGPGDFARFDLIVAMDEQNRRDIERQRPAGSTTPVTLFLSYGPSPRRDVPDPYYDGGFEEVLHLIEHAARGLLAHLVPPATRSDRS